MQDKGLNISTSSRKYYVYNIMK